MPPRALWAAASVEASYREKLLSLINEMTKSVLYWVVAARRKDEPKVAVLSDKLAMDDFASVLLGRAMRDLKRQWFKRFNQAAEALARYFAKSVSDRTDGQLKQILRDAGIAIKFEMTHAQQDVLGAIVRENVALIKTIPQKYLAEVEGHVMRSVALGRDLKSLTDDLHGTFYKARKYAAFVALDQNNKATGALQRVRFLENKIEEADWMHSHAGREPRPSHVKAGKDKVRFNVATGWYDPDEKKYIWPGQLIRCRCTCKPVVVGFE